jgi:predicted Zn-dependent peptidase
MIAATDIAYQSFTLPNGLRVIVHTDRRTPVVAVNVWYNVGSRTNLRARPVSRISSNI